MGVDIDKNDWKKIKESPNVAKSCQIILYPTKKQKKQSHYNCISNDHKIKWQYLNILDYTGYWNFSFSLGYKISITHSLRISSLIENDICKLLTS